MSNPQSKRFKNILVKAKSPDWWVKIGDFGISKRAQEGKSALHTFGGTLAYMAPEVLLRQLDDDNGISTLEEYTSTVDIWSVGVIAFQMLTSKLPFSIADLRKYAKGMTKFPKEELTKLETSSEASNFVESLLRSDPGQRPDAKSCLDHAWLRSLDPSEDSESDNLDVDIEVVPVEIDPDQATIASARWTTVEESLHQTIRHSTLTSEPFVTFLAKRSAAPTSMKVPSDTIKPIESTVASIPSGPETKFGTDMAQNSMAPENGLYKRRSTCTLKSGDVYEQKSSLTSEPFVTFLAKQSAAPTSKNLPPGTMKPMAGTFASLSSASGAGFRIDMAQDSVTLEDGNKASLTHERIPMPYASGKGERTYFRSDDLRAVSPRTSPIPENETKTVPKPRFDTGLPDLDRQKTSPTSENARPPSRAADGERSHIPIRSGGGGSPSPSRSDIVPSKERPVYSIDSGKSKVVQPPRASILKTPTIRFPEDPNPIREGVAPLKDRTSQGIPANARWTKMSQGIPANARWTRIDRRIVNPEALQEARERFEAWMRV